MRGGYEGWVVRGGSTRQGAAVRAPIFSEPHHLPPTDRPRTSGHVPAPSRRCAPHAAPRCALPRGRPRALRRRPSARVRVMARARARVRARANPYPNPSPNPNPNPSPCPKPNLHPSGLPLAQRGGGLAQLGLAPPAASARRHAAESRAARLLRLGVGVGLKVLANPDPNPNPNDNPNPNANRSRSRNPNPNPNQVWG